jgi:hypothetical protein
LDTGVVLRTIMGTGMVSTSVPMITSRHSQMLPQRRHSQGPWQGIFLI